jgi:hypothetical protein
MTKTQMWLGGTQPVGGTLTFTPTRRAFKVARFKYLAKGKVREVIFLNYYDAIGRVPSLQRVKVETASRRSPARSTTRGGN